VECCTLATSRLVGLLAPDDHPVRLPRHQRGDAADQLMTRFAQGRIVHGTASIADNWAQPEESDGPHSYADGKVLAVDGGLFDGGPCWSSTGRRRHRR